MRFYHICCSESCAFFQIGNNYDDDDDGDMCMMSTTDYGPLLYNDTAMVFFMRYTPFVSSGSDLINE